MPIFTKDKRLEEKSFVFEGEPEKIDVEVEAKKMHDQLGFNAKKLADALVIIGQRMYGVPLYQYQIAPAKRIIYSMLVNDGAEITLLLARQSGKSECVTFCVLVIGIFFPVLAKYFKELDQFKFGVKMGLIAPQLDQVETVYDRCMTRLWSEEVIEFISDKDINDEPLSKVQFKLRSGSSLKAQSGAKQSKIESKTYSIVFLDEAQDMGSEKVRKSIIPMLAATFGTLVRSGTPNRTKGDFYIKINQNKKKDRGIKESKKEYELNHFEYDYKQIIKHKKEQFKKDGKPWHLLYEKSIKRDMDTMGENSEDFRLSYKLEWMIEQGMFITENRLDEKVYKYSMNFPKINSEDFVVAGLDIGKAKASTVLTIGVLDSPAYEIGDRPKKVVQAWYELPGTNYEYQLHIISELLIKHNVRILAADATGVGAAIVDPLVYYLGEYIQIIPCIFSTPFKSEMWKTLDEDIDANRVNVPCSKSIQNTPEYANFNQQALFLTKEWKGPYLVCQKTPGYLDDYMDSLGLMNVAGNTLYEISEPMNVSENPFLLNGIKNRVKSSWS